MVRSRAVRSRYCGFGITFDNFSFLCFYRNKTGASNWTMIGTGQGPLFFGGPRGPNSGISAEQKLVAADNFLQNSKNSRDARLRRATPATPPAARAGVATDPHWLPSYCCRARPRP